ncbi:hypothetical protein HS7_18490 [Sulfolobales archaeon HS-7]|nr:hypothetical protein HS7_18490 [Sulfolobales archaeon HS-7]
MSILPNLLYEIQRIIPGYRGYFIKNQIAKDDALVRNTAALWVSEALAKVENERNSVGSSMGLNLSGFDFEKIKQYDTLINALREIYTQLIASPSGLRSLPLDQVTLNQLIQFDYQLITACKSLVDNPSTSIITQVQNLLLERKRILYDTVIKP